MARAQVPARLLDLSLGGALFVLDAALDVGAVHDFALDVSGEPLWVQAEVRRCQRAARGPGYEVGVEFIGIAPQDVKRLETYLGDSRR